MKEARIATRLYIEGDLAPEQNVELGKQHAHFLKSVLRLEPGSMLLVFNGRQGEWLAEIAELDKKTGRLTLRHQTRPQEEGGDIWVAVAPVTAGRIDWLVEKATELGAARLLPVITRRTVVDRVKLHHQQPNAREAAEQSERLDVPEILEPQPLERLLQQWPAERTLLVAAETGSAEPRPEALEALSGPAGLLIGPEGGFAPEELELVARAPIARRVSLGPRILRAETAALAALAVVQAARGAWGKRPRGGPEVK